MLSLGAVLGLSVLATMGLSLFCLVEGAHPGWSTHAAPIKRPLFRPWDRAGSTSFASRLRSQVMSVSRQSTSIGDARRQDVFPAKRAGGRKVVPVTRGQDLGLRFRPDEGDSAYGQSGVPSAHGGPGNPQSDLQFQFRPIQSRRKPTYEELQAGDVSPQPPIQPLMPYPVLPPPPPGYGGGGYSPNW